MLALARWSTTHRRYVLIGWVLLLVVVNAFAQSAGTSYSNNFTLPNSDAQRAANLLERSFPTQAGDRDTIVFKVSSGTVQAPAVRQRMRRCSPAWPRSRTLRASSAPTQAPRPARRSPPTERSPSQPSSSTRRPGYCPRAPRSGRRRWRGGCQPGLQVALGGQAIEQTEQAGFGLSTAVGLLAAIVVLLLTFGSLVAMGLPIVTALFGLGTGLGAIALFTHIVDTPNFSSELAAMIGLGVGIDYALFILTRFREAYATPGPTFENSRESVVQAMDTAGRAVLFAGSTVVIALLGMMLLGVAFLYGVALSASIGVLLVMLASLTLLPALLTFAGGRVAGKRRTRSADARAREAAATGAPRAAAGQSTAAAPGFAGARSCREGRGRSRPSQPSRCSSSRRRPRR